MKEIFKAMTNGCIKKGRRIYHLYDCSGRRVIDNSTSYLKGSGRDTIEIDRGNGWIAVYCWPKMS